MKILFWTDHFYPIIGGVQVIAVPVILALRARGHDIVVVTSRNDTNQPEQAEYLGIPIRRFDFWNALGANDPLQVLRERSVFARFLREFAPDLIHLFGVGPTQLFYLTTRNQYTAPMLATLQDEDSVFLTQTGQDSVLGRALETADWVISVTQIEVERLCELMPSLQIRIQCLHNALPLPSLVPAPLPVKPQLMTLGRLSPEKSFDLAIRAFALVAPRFPDAHLQIIGDGPERSKLEHLAKTLGIAEQTDLLGWVMPPLVPAQINQATAVVLSSRTEGLPLAAIEAAQMARPLIAPRVGGIPELVLDGETGLLTKPGDVTDMARAMEQIIASPTRATAMGLAARRHIEANFNFDTIVETYQELFERLPAQARERALVQ